MPPSDTQSASPQGSGGQYKQRVIKYSFWSQSSALLVKSARNQSRAIKTNICLISFPIALSLALFSFQFLVDGLIASSDAGRFSPAISRPPLSPHSLYLPLASDKCPIYQTIPIDTENGRIMLANHGLDLGVYGGPTLDPLTQALLPPGFVSPYNASEAEGLLGNASTPLSTFLANTALTDSDGSIYSLCFSSPTFQYPVLSQVTERSQIEETTYKSWGKSNYMSAIDVSELDLSGNRVRFDVYYNFTLTGGSDLPIFINFVSNALWRMLIGDSVGVYLGNPGRKDFPRGVKDNSFDIVSLGGPNLYIYIFLLLLPITMENLVSEKETRLRETMRMMGLKTHVYFLSTYLWNFFLYMCLVILALVIGAALGFAFWIKNNFLSYFVLLFIWGHTLIAMSWLLSIFITSSRTAVVMGYAIILAFGILCTNLIRDIVISVYTPDATLFGISIIPPLAFFRGLTLINNEVAWKGEGMTLSEIGSSGLGYIYLFLAIEWLVCITFAIYFELVLPIGPGAKKDPLFFLPRRFWLFKTDEAKELARERAALKRARGDNSMEMTDLQNGQPGKILSASGNHMLDEDDDKPEDVLAEEVRTLEADNLVVKALGLHKVYTRGSKRKVAVRHLTMGIRHGECFGFLGPNGAGKSTTISMLCGYLRPTSGNATINGLSIREDIDEIHLQMGVCPQDDALWPSLTGPEHLEFYGRMKNLKGKELKQEIEFWLEQVNLHSSKTKVKASSEYSGGMKRRLSVACAMIGNPSVVLLDEPTTGLDPASRIALWDVVRKFKSHCAMMLTTHSMDEAEALCDRLGIFVAGRLKTVGHSSELKERYGRFYKIQITTTTGADAQILELLQSLSPNARLLNSLAGANNFEAPSDEIDLATLFDAVEANKKSLGIAHWGVSNTTLEEIFLKVTQDEVQDEALKFAQKKSAKRGCCGGCCGGHADDSAHDATMDVEDAPQPALHRGFGEGNAGFVADPASSSRRLEAAVNEYSNEEEDEEGENQSSSTATEDSQELEESSEDYDEDTDSSN
jgi:ABC-type multidrug transport system ATPase subunit